MELKTLRLSFNLAGEGEIWWFKAVAYIAALSRLEHRVAAPCT